MNHKHVILLTFITLASQGCLSFFGIDYVSTDTAGCEFKRRGEDCKVHPQYGTIYDNATNTYTITTSCVGVAHIYPDWTCAILNFPETKKDHAKGANWIYHYTCKDCAPEPAVYYP